MAFGGYTGIGGRPPARISQAGAKDVPKLNVKFKQQHIAVLHDVFLAFHGVKAFFAGCADGTAFNEIVVSDGFGVDEAAFENL
jgi:hypothetical protein